MQNLELKKFFRNFSSKIEILSALTEICSHLLEFRWKSAMSIGKKQLLAPPTFF